MKVIITQYNRSTIVENVERIQYSVSQRNTVHLNMGGGKYKSFEEITFLIIE